MQVRINEYDCCQSLLQLLYMFAIPLTPRRVGGRQDGLLAELSGSEEHKSARERGDKDEGGVERKGREKKERRGVGDGRGQGCGT